MRRDLVYRDEIMDSLVKEYNRKRTNDGLKLAWIEKAVNDVKPAPPEIIYCKDCRHRDDHGCCKYWRGLAMSETPIATDDYDFCNHARRREREH